MLSNQRLPDGVYDQITKPTEMKAKVPQINNPAFIIISF